MKKWKDIQDWVAGNDHKLKGLILAVNSRMYELFPGEDEPKPECPMCGDSGSIPAVDRLGTTPRSIPCPECCGEPEPAPEDPPDYSCPHCGCRTDFHCETCERCITRPFRDLAAANRRIAQLTRERDEARRTNLSYETGEIIYRQARAQAIQDTKDAAVKALYYVADNYADGQQAFSRHLRWAADHFRHLEV